jgi:predicted NUDIX family NTP pyrophosphohydrolase
MSQVSAGLLMVRRCAQELEFLLAHPGGPFFANKDDGAWSIPKGLTGEGEDFLAAAIREFSEETGLTVETEQFVPLGTVRQKGGKLVHAWAFEGDCDPATVRSNRFAVQWPPRSGKWQSFPEIDRAAFFTAEAARRKLLPAQIPFIDRAIECLIKGRRGDGRETR